VTLIELIDPQWLNLNLRAALLVDLFDSFRDRVENAHSLFAELHRNENCAPPRCVHTLENLDQSRASMLFRAVRWFPFTQCRNGFKCPSVESVTQK
jgi:hypothetical protein